MAAILTDSGHRQKYKNFKCTKYLAATLTGGTQWPVFLLSVMLINLRPRSWSHDRG